MADTRLCLIPDCGKMVWARGWCGMHYRRWRIYGNPLFTKVASPGKPFKYFKDVVVPYDGDDCLIWPFSRTPAGYGQLRSDGAPHPVHRMACEEINGPPPTSKHQAAHSCGNGHLGCINPRHLRWATPKENCGDRVAHGTENRGERCGSAKLNRNQVREIRKLEGSNSQVEIAKRFGVDRKTISHIHHRKRWAWLD